MTSALYNTICSLKRTRFNVRDQALLVKSLECLRDSVGNEGIKKTIANSVNSLLIYKDKSTTRGEGTSIEDAPRLHTAIYGSPGTGKTLLAKILASIWYSVGMIKNAKGSELKDKENGGVSMPTSLDSMESVATDSMLWVIFKSVLVYVVYVAVSRSWNMLGLSERFGVELVERLVLQAMLTAAICATMWLAYAYVRSKVRASKNASTSKAKSSENEATSKTDSRAQEGSRKTDNMTYFEQYADILESENILLRSPADFIGKYMGHTAEKTRLLLNSALGKVLFVDEAYGFLPRNDFGYGKEALNEITSFLDAHKGELIIIFAGYEDLLRNGVFAAQKGLDRRFGMHLTCSGYKMSELFKMLCNRVRSTGMIISKDAGCYEEFCKGDYRYFAGDMDILVGYLYEPLAETYVITKSNICTERLKRRAIATDRPQRAKRIRLDVDVDVDVELEMEMEPDESGLGSSIHSTDSDHFSQESDDGIYEGDTSYEEDAQGYCILKGDVDMEKVMFETMVITPEVMRVAVSKLNDRRITAPEDDKFKCESVLNSLSAYIQN